MKTLYVNKKSEVSLLKHSFEEAGFRCLRVRTFCECRDQGNIRAGVIVLKGDRVVMEIRRCKSCVKQKNHNLYDGGSNR